MLGVAAALSDFPAMRCRGDGAETTKYPYHLISSPLSGRVCEPPLFGGSLRNDISASLYLSQPPVYDVSHDIQKSIITFLILISLALRPRLLPRTTVIRRLVAG